MSAIVELMGQDMTSEGWRADAACRGADVSLWFPEPGGASDANLARAICRSCPVQQECLDYALHLGRTLDGIWGGLTETERRRYRNRLRQTRKESAA